MPDAQAAADAQSYLQTCMQSGNSSGGIIEGIITGVPAGIGEPVFGKLDSELARAIFSIGAVKGFEIGDGFEAARATGLSNNDAFYYDETGKLCKKTNHAGGILGGISDGDDIIYRAALKQDTVTKNGENISVCVKGRHDPVIVPRAVVVVEAMSALTLADAVLENMAAQADIVAHFYQHL